MTVGHFDTKKYSYSVSPFPRHYFNFFYPPPESDTQSPPPYLTSFTIPPRNPFSSPCRTPSSSFPPHHPVPRTLGTGNEWTRPLRFRSRRDAVIVSSIVPVPPHPPVSTSTFPCMLHCLISFPVLSRPSLFFLPCPYPPFVTAHSRSLPAIPNVSCKLLLNRLPCALTSVLEARLRRSSKRSTRRTRFRVEVSAI